MPNNCLRCNVQYNWELITKDKINFSTKEYVYKALCPSCLDSMQLSIKFPGMDWLDEMKALSTKYLLLLE